MTNLDSAECVADELATSLEAVQVRLCNRFLFAASRESQTMEKVQKFGFRGPIKYHGDPER